MPTLTVRCVWTDTADASLGLPGYATDGAAGADLRANLPVAERGAGITLAPGERRLVPTGIVIELPQGTEAQVRPRSGLALRHGITLINSPGTIDCDYRGEVGVPLVNLGQEPFTVTHGMRIAQMVVAPVTRVRFDLTAEAGHTERGSGGFGSTGTG